MGNIVSSVLKKVSPIANKLSFGATGIVDNMLDKYAGTDIGGFKEAQAQAKAEEDARNVAAFNSQMNNNIIGQQGAQNVAQVEAGGTASDVSGMMDNKRRRAGSISSTLGI